MVGIVSFGGYIPRLRLSRKSIVDANGWQNSALKAYAKAERAICNWDEDSLTMAVEAARDCLIGQDRSKIAAVYFASTTFPFDDRLNSGVAAEALNLGSDLNTLDVSASQRAGTSGLIAALRTAGAGGGQLLYLAGEKRRTKAASQQELLYGDGAVALLLGDKDPVAKFVGSQSEAVDFVDHYRGHGVDFDYAWEERWIRDEGYNKIVPPVIAAALEKLKLKAGDIAHFCMPVTLRGVAVATAKKLGIAESAVRDNLDGRCGDTGTAHALVMLVHALQEAKPGDKIMVVGFGQGCDVMVFEATPALTKLAPRAGIVGSLAKRKPETNYNKYLSFNNLVTTEKGLRAELDKQTALSTLYRKRDMLTGLIGGKCSKCGTVQYPKSNICVNPNCNAMHSQEDHPFADMAGQVNSYTADLLTYSPDPPAHYGMVQFAEGGRMMIDFADVDVGGIQVGMPMRMVFRIKEYDQQRGFTKYFWKAAPAAASSKEA
ncbi:MAG TPA: 3-oxoacyl-[acyl-carrier-protein] synthase III C-terminal domain-containing protein [Candidatus Sulfotelmatobacter sp.]|nr:3-oxoacyl-[acyl-carrier-protein] synthase III C-terminal domain-containing protein [Candidatus Sulfotelmatobacter sp.]